MLGINILHLHSQGVAIDRLVNGAPKWMTRPDISGSPQRNKSSINWHDAQILLDLVLTCKQNL